jgi:hypothetical protein
VSPCIVIQGPSGLQFSKVWGRFGMGAVMAGDAIGCGPHTSDGANSASCDGVMGR